MAIHFAALANPCFPASFISFTGFTDPKILSEIARFESFFLFKRKKKADIGAVSPLDIFLVA